MLTTPSLCLFSFLCKQFMLDMNIVSWKCKVSRHSSVLSYPWASCESTYYHPDGEISSRVGRSERTKLRLGDVEPLKAWAQAWFSSRLLLHYVSTAAEQFEPMWRIWGQLPQYAEGPKSCIYVDVWSFSLCIYVAGEVQVWNTGSEDETLVASSGLGSDSHREPVTKVTPSPLLALSPHAPPLPRPRHKHHLYPFTFSQPF